ncbi:hypothetical protein CYLTODRAFT_423168 [Cylindrobasidium torrendii FP15055 ss-10]|uniref:Uncharacterized protein n=1 Tax=Cylindrobasidium torrendii FP15055 ss-10 TaxID=1314674 RepID=A0A0D7B915_9AGAR|nr:hypothetical protein CYLTODRAFT_423168 [Cylindrobasidium torrendii FP15055 ss-10]
MLNYTPAPARRTHKKRTSALRLSTETTATLPEYHSHHNWNQRPDSGNPLDLPPDYEDSAEEADEDTDDEGQTLVYSPPSTSSLPTKPRRRQSHHRRKSSSPSLSSDSFLDSLLERSVHALEISNVLLQSSMSTQTTFAHLNASDSQLETTYTRSALHSRSGSSHHWSDDLEEINRDVDRLFLQGSSSKRNSGHSSRSEGSISMSVPISSSPPPIHAFQRRRPSLDSVAPSSALETPKLRLAATGRERLIAQAPRAMTQYVGHDEDLGTIRMPSTLGLRSGASAYPATPSPPQPPPSSARAYTMLSSFVNSAAGPSNLSRRSSSTSTERSGGHTPRRASSTRTLRSRSQTPKPITIPTIEEVSQSSDSSDGVHARMTVKSLRRILSDQPPPPPHSAILTKRFPITPIPTPEASTSTATASISRLFTKGTHSSTTRPRSPPRQSVLKSGTATPRTPASSVPSTPKRISFAELPEAHQSSTGKFKAKDKKRRDKKKGKGKEEEQTGWWSWLASGLTTPTGIERIEDRVQRGWGGPRMDDWGV